MISSQLVQACLAGDEDAVQTFVRAYQRPVFLLALSILDEGVGPEVSPAVIARAEAATQQTFMVALDRLGRYREDTPFEPWLFAIAIDVARKRARRARMTRMLSRLRPAPKSGMSPVLTLPQELGEDYAARPTAGDAASSGSSTAAGSYTAADSLWPAVRQLPEHLRLPVVLRYYHDFSVEQIAGMLKLSKGAVHARLDTAREKIAGSGLDPEKG